MSRGSRKPGLKNAIETYDAVENNEKIILISSFEHTFINWDITYLNVYLVSLKVSLLDVTMETQVKRHN